MKGRFFMKKIFACAFLLGLCSVSVFKAVADEVDKDYTTMEYYETTGTECKKIKRSDSYVGHCDRKTAGQSCTDEISNIPIHKNAATKAECVWVKASGGKHLSCAATNCDDDHMLWLGYDNINKRS